MKTEIYYVVEDPDWVQGRRWQVLQAYQQAFRFKRITKQRFEWGWRLGFFRHKPVIFATWRTLHALVKAGRLDLSDEDFKYFLAAVTSHSTIGGGLDPRNPIPGREPEEAYALAVGLLSRCGVVTVNSRILYDLLHPALPAIHLCQNGVDVEAFTPSRLRRYRPDRLRVGWVGKDRGPKNMDVLEAVQQVLRQEGTELELMRLSKKLPGNVLSEQQMCQFYQGLDYYLCASWNEGTPNPALEAAACGVPVVSTPVGNMPEMITNSQNGFLVEPTVESIVDCFRELRQLDETRYRALSEQARSVIERDWTWKDRIHSFVRAYEDLVYGEVLVHG